MSSTLPSWMDGVEPNWPPHIHPRVRHGADPGAELSRVRDGTVDPPKTFFVGTIERGADRPRQPDAEFVDRWTGLERSDPFEEWVTDEARRNAHPGPDVRQVHEGDFLMHDDYVVVYCGDETGLEPFYDDTTLRYIRVLHAKKLAVTDLASIPKFARWWVSPYGAHTPAALVHDWLIRDNERRAGSHEVVPDRHADRYFRYMLIACGINPITAWLMWTAVAGRSRWSHSAASRLSLIVWVCAAVVGLVALFTSLAAVISDVEPLFGWVGDLDPWPTLAASIAVGVAASALWGRQFGAGLVAMVFSPIAVPAVSASFVTRAFYFGLIEPIGSALSSPLRAIDGVITRRRADGDKVGASATVQARVLAEDAAFADSDG